MFYKLKWMLMILALIWISLPAPSMGARMSYGKWWRIPHMTEQLDLKDTEKKELDQLYVESRRSLIDIKSTLEKERFELDNLMEQTTLDEEAVMERFKKLEKARADLAAERFRFMLQVRKVLGPERYQGLKMLFKEFREKGRHDKKR